MPICRLRPLAAVLLLSLLVAGCAPRADRTAGSERPHLLPAGLYVSSVKAIAMRGENEELSENVFRFVVERLEHQTERELKQVKRWRADGEVELHLETEYIRLRKSIAALVLSNFSGTDEMRVKVWVTRASEVIAEDTVTTRYYAGGIYSTMSSGHRLKMLVDQIARKVVHMRL